MLSLENLEFEYEPRFRAMICRRCKTSILPNDLVNHVRKDHSVKSWSVGKLGELFGQYKLATFDTIWKPDVSVTAILNLGQHEAYMCTFPTCNKILSLKRNMAFHVKSHGPLITFRAITCQRVFESKKSPFFEVTPEARELHQQNLKLPIS